MAANTGVDEIVGHGHDGERQILFIEDVAQVLRTSRSTIERRRRAGSFPIPELPSIDIFFISVSQGPKYENSHSISILVDGRQFSFGSKDADFYSTKKGEFFVEGTGFTLTYENLQGLVSAREVAVQLGATTFKLGPDHVAALREMGRRMKGQH